MKKNNLITEFQEKFIMRREDTERGKLIKTKEATKGWKLATLPDNMSLGTDDDINFYFFPDLEVHFLTETKTSPELYDDIIVLLNPTKEDILKKFDEITEKNQGDDSFRMTGVFLWRRAFEDGTFTQSEDSSGCATREYMSSAFDYVMEEIQKGKKISLAHNKPFMHGVGFVPEYMSLATRDGVTFRLIENLGVSFHPKAKIPPKIYGDPIELYPPTRETVLKAFDAIMEEHQGDDLFYMDVFFIWEKVFENGELIKFEDYLCTPTREELSSCFDEFMEAAQSYS